MSVLSDMKIAAASLPESKRRIMLSTMLAMGASIGNSAGDEPEEIATPKRGPGRPRKADAAPAKVAAKNSAKPAKDGKRVKREVSVEDEEKDRNAKRTTGKAGKVAKETTAKPAKTAPAKTAAPKVSSTADYSDMSKSELIAAAEKLGIKNTKLLKGGSALVRVMTGITKLTNGSKSVSAIEKMAKAADVDLVFGPGRPPGNDEGAKRRILVKMANENAFAG